MEIKDLFLLLRRSAPYLALGLLIGAALGLIATIVQQPVYEASTKILVSQTRQQSNADALPLSIDQLVTTYLQLVKTQPVLDDASSQLGTKIDPDNIQVAVISNTQIIQIKVQDRDSKRAAATANALFQILVQQNETLQSGRYKTYEDALNIRIDLVQRQISDLQNQVNQINTASIQEQLTQVNQEIEQLQKEMSGLDQDILSFPTFLTDAQRATLAEKQAQLDQERLLLTFYQQIKANLTYLRTPAQGSVPNNDPRLASLQSTLNVYQQLNLTMLNNLESVRLARMQNTPNVSQIDPAIPPKNPIRPLPFLYVILGGFVGFIISGCTILMVDHLDDSLKTADQAEQLLGIPVLGFVPERNHAQSKLSSLGDPLSAETESFRDLAVSVALAGAGKKALSLLVTDAGSAKNKTTIAAKLAIANALQGKHVILLDGDLGNPHLHKLFEADNQKGLVDILQDGMDIKSASHSVENIEGLTFIPSGAVTKDSTRWVEVEELAKLLVKLKKQADLVIVDGPAAELADAQLLASQMDATLLLIQSGDIEADSAQATIKRFQSTGAKMAGTVLYRTQKNWNLKPTFSQRVKTKPSENKETQEAAVEQVVNPPLVQEVKIKPDRNIEPQEAAAEQVIKHELVQEVKTEPEKNTELQETAPEQVVKHELVQEAKTEPDKNIEPQEAVVEQVVKPSLVQRVKTKRGKNKGPQEAAVEQAVKPTLAHRVKTKPGKNKGSNEAAVEQVVKPPLVRRVKTKPGKNKNSREMAVEQVFFGEIATEIKEAAPT